MLEAVINTIISEAENNGFTGVAKIGVGLDAVYNFVENTRQDYENGDYTNLAIDAGIAIGSVAVGLAVAEIGGDVLFGMALEGAAEVLGNYFVQLTSVTATELYTSALRDEASGLSGQLDSLAKSIYDGATDVT